jgi:hypothetical protein
MRENSKKKNGTNTAMSVDRAANEAAKDPASSKLRSASGLGNEAIQKRLSQGKSNQSEMLQFLVQRLGTMRAVQLQEMKLLDEKHMAENKGAIADEQKSDKTAPDPERWRASAALYEQAAVHLCRGALARGADLLKQAVAAERLAFHSLTALVDLSAIEAEHGAVQPGDPPVSSDDLEVTGTAATGMPDGVELAKEIQDVVREAPNITWRKRTRDPWWTLDEEEEEEEEAGGTG